MNIKTAYNFGLSTLSAMARSQRGLGLPVHLTVEPTTFCNLKCPVCETGAGILERPHGMLTLDNFKRIIDAVGPQVNTLFLYYMGETYLNKDAPQMVSYAVDKGIYVSVCTNGEQVDATELIGSQCSEVNFQIGGLMQETHEKYRVGGELGLTMYNIREAVKNKKMRKSKVRINVGFIVMKHNEHELGKMQQLYNLGVDNVHIISPCVRTVEQGEKFLPSDYGFWYYDRYAFGKGLLRPKVVPHNRCWWIYYSTVVTWDGNVVPCCRDAQGHNMMGNVFNQPFEEIWNGERYRTFRRQISESQHAVTICRLCSGFGVPRLY